MIDPLHPFPEPPWIERPMSLMDPREREALLALLVEHAPAILWSTDTDLRFTSSFGGGLAHLGLQPDQVVGSTLFEFLQTDDPDDPRIAAHCRALEGTSDGYEQEWMGRTFRFQVEPWRALDGTVRGTIAVGFDITEYVQAEEALRRSEECFRSLVQHASDLVVILDPNGMTRFVSPAVQQLLGYNPDELLHGTVFPLVHPEDRDKIRQFLADAVEQPDRTPSVEVRVRHHDGTWRWFEARGSNRLADPSVRGIVVNSRDVTESKQAQDALRSNQQRYETLLAAAERQARELALLHVVRTALARELDLPRLFQTVVHAIADTFGYTQVSLYLLDGEHLVLQHQVGYARVLERVPIAQGVMGRVVRTGEPEVIEDVASDPAFLSAIEGIVSEVCVPLRDQGRVVGTLNGESTSQVRLSQGDLRLALALSEHINVALARTRLYAEVRSSEARFRSLVQNASDVIAIVDADGTRRYVSPGIERALGYAPEVLVGANVFDLIHPDDLPRTRRLFAELLERAGASSQAELRLRHRDGSWRWLDVVGTNLLANPSVGGVVINSRDVTERKAFEARLARQAFYDPVTALPNRALFIDRLDRALEEERRSGAAVGVLFLDLDRFKVINDSLGHDAGDQALRIMGERLGTCSRPGDTVARFGGDEFTVLLEGCDPEEATRIADRVLASLRSPVELKGHEVLLGASVGIAVSRPGLDGPGDLLRAADTALYQAKAAGRATWVAFEPSMHEEAVARLELEAALQLAIERSELRLVYQPEVDLATGRVLAVEALVRWHRRGQRPLLPEAFVPLAEETGLIVPIGQWALAEACRQAQTWSARGMTPTPVSVNLSAQECRQGGLVAYIARVLRETALPPQLLRLEITERALIEDYEATEGTLRDLQRLGVRLAIDDFGTGYSSLSSLRRLPVDTLKINRSFVAGLGDEAADRAIVEAITSLAHALGMDVAAEGIETPEQVAHARAAGCDCGQGYYFAEPRPPEAVDTFLPRSSEAVTD